MLIVGRAVAGAGAAALFSGGMNIIGYSVPLRKRAMYIAALSSMFGIASVVGYDTDRQDLDLSARSHPLTYLL